MSAKAISEQTGKEFLYKYICTSAAVQNRFRYASVTAETDWDRLTQEHPWLLTEVTLPCCGPYRALDCYSVGKKKIYGDCETRCLHAQKVSRSRYAITIRKLCDFVSKCVNQVCPHMHLQSHVNLKRYI